MKIPASDLEELEKLMDEIVPDYAAIYRACKWTWVSDNGVPTQKRLREHILQLAERCYGDEEDSYRSGGIEVEWYPSLEDSASGPTGQWGIVFSIRRFSGSTIRSERDLLRNLANKLRRKA